MSDLFQTARDMASKYLYSGDYHIWSMHVKIFHYVPIFCTIMPIITTPMGKTTIKSIFNVPGKLYWVTMELVSPTSFLLSLFLNNEHSIQHLKSLPATNLILSACFLAHYAHRALISPLRAPNITDAHIVVWIAAVVFNYFNGYSLGAWFLIPFGKVDQTTPWWQARFALGVSMFVFGLWSNIWHESILYDIRRRAIARKAEAGRRKKDDDYNGTITATANGDVNKVKVETDEQGKKRVSITVESGQVYEVPEGGLFEYCWHPHYFVEWIEWTGFLIATGGACPPAINFLVNELATMLPRAFQGKLWYKEKFGRNAPNRKAAIPFVL